MKKTHDLVATIGTYKDRNGDEKKRYTKLGAAFTDDQGRISLKLDAVPCSPDWSGWVSLYDVDRDRGQHSQPVQRQAAPRDEWGDPVRTQRRDDDQIPGLEKGAVPRPQGQDVPF